MKTCLMNTIKQKQMKVSPTNVFLIEITKAIAFMPMDMYTQWASRSENNKFYVSRGARGYVSISAKNVTILAQQIIFINQ